MRAPVYSPSPETCSETLSNCKAHTRRFSVTSMKLLAFVKQWLVVVWMGKKMSEKLRGFDNYVWNSVEINKNILCADRVTRMLQRTRSGHPRLNLALRLLCPVAGGSRIVEDTSWSTHAVAVLNASWRFSLSRVERAYARQRLEELFCGVSARELVHEVHQPGSPDSIQQATHHVSELVLDFGQGQVAPGALPLQPLPPTGVDLYDRRVRRQ